MSVIDFHIKRKMSLDREKQKSDCFRLLVTSDGDLPCKETP